MVPDALPRAALDNRTLVMTGWLHYGLGNTLSQIVDVFNYHLQLKLTPGGLLHMWGRLQAVLMSIYRTLKQRGHHPLETVTQAIHDYLTTGKLPPLPTKSTSDS